MNSTENPYVFNVGSNQWIIPKFKKIDEPELITYTIRVDTAVGGSAAVIPQKDTYLPNENVKLTAVPDRGYEFTGWTGTMSSAQNPLVFNVSSNQWIIPQFRQIPDTITYSVKIDTAAGGSASVEPQKDAYSPGENVKLTAAPDSGYEFTGWTGTINSTANPLVFNVISNQWIIPQFRKIDEPEVVTYTVRVDTAVGGSTTVAPQKDTYSPNEIVRLTATPASGFEFTGWTGTMSSTQNPYVFNVTSDQWIIPQFRKIDEPEVVTYTITVDTAVGGSAALAPQKASYSPNEIVRLTATPASGFEFTGWTGTMSSTQNPLVFNVTSNQWIIPQFRQISIPEVVTYTITVDTAVGGTVDRTPKKDTYSPNEMVRLTAEPRSGFEFTGWTGTMNSTQNPLMFNITSNQWIIPQFKRISIPEVVTYTVNVDTAVGGSAAIVPQKATYSPNEMVRLTATPASGYEFTGWTGTTNTAQNPYVFNVNSDQWIIPQFRRISVPEVVTYTVNVDTAVGGSAVAVPQKNTYSPNEIVKLTASAESGYTFTGWTGTINTTQNPYVFNISSNQWIIPQFKQVVTYHLLTELNPMGGTVTSSAGNKISFLPGEQCALKAAPSAGYQFDGWEGDIETSNDTVYITFDKDYQVYPRFSVKVSPVTYTLTIPTGLTGGSIQWEPKKSAYYDKEVVRLSAEPASGYIFSSWNTDYSGKPETFDIVMNSNKTILAPVFTQRKWTFIVYMAADNDLEPAAIADFNELESAPSNGSSSILVLFDRSVGNDTSNGNWTDTRLFEIQHDPNGNDGNIISKRIAFPQRGLTVDTETELDMSNPLVLSDLLKFAKQKYAAENYGLIIWGHGTGWRGTGSAFPSGVEPLRAVALDGPSNYMTIKALGQAINSGGLGNELKVIAFDTCFGALMEIAYQLKGSADWLVGSEGAIPAAGWDYGSLFTSFFGKATRTGDTFCDSAIEQFKNQYIGTNGVTISKMHLASTFVDPLFSKLEEFSKLVAEKITTPAIRDTVLDSILRDIEVYHFATYPSDMYMDLYSFAEKMAGIFPSLAASGNALKSSINQMVVKTWSKKSGEPSGSEARKNIGVYVIPLQAPASPYSSHDPAYINGTTGFGNSSFVEASQYWVPHSTPKSNSFLDKLFYWNF
ncbi:hypothetical protein FACS1894109_10580 [Spirochaetia bacterium]|nr:hypothetical protein FACS1894109_10580 [Spirochaetia bacterium]